MKLKLRLPAGSIGVALGVSLLMSPACAAQAIIDQKGLKFVPTEITINAGDSILFKNSDPFTHNVTVVSSNGTRMDKGLQHHGEDKAIVFSDKGTFSIVCTMHPNMKATVIVK
jgi:plastocyanin